MQKIRYAVLIGFLALQFGCVSESTKRVPQNDPSVSTYYMKTDRPHMCAALRGNGTRIFATIESLAGISEYLGPIDGVSGASSGGAATFLYESMMINPAVWNCPGNDPGQRTACSREEAGRRISLLAKSVRGYMRFLEDKTDVQHILAAETIGDQIKTHKLNIQDVGLGYEAIKTALGNSDIRELINPEIYSTPVTDVFNLKTFTDRIRVATQQVTNFDAKENEALFRPGLLSVEHLAMLMARMGNFYASYEPTNTSGTRVFWNHPAWLKFLDTCTPSTADGQTWDDLATNPKNLNGQTVTCETLLNQMIRDYRVSLQTKEGERTTREQKMNPSRETDPMGGFIHSFNSVSSVWGPGKGDQLQEQLNNYLSFKAWELHPSFEDFRISYFGSPEDLKLVGEQLPKMYPDDEKSQKFHPLLSPADSFPKGATWLTAMTRSASEPGLSHAWRYDADTFTFGGWLDAHPTLILRAIGCEKVVYVTREGTESDFAVSASELLGSTDQDRANLFSLHAPGPSNVRSSFQTSLNESDAVWCSHYNDVGAFDIPGLVQSGHNATLVVNDVTRSSVRTHSKGAEEGLWSNKINNAGTPGKTPRFVYQSEVLQNRVSSSGISTADFTSSKFYGCVDGARPMGGEEQGPQDQIAPAPFHQH